MNKCNVWCTNCNCGATSSQQSSQVELSDKEIKQIDKGKLAIYCINAQKKEEIPLKIMGYAMIQTHIDKKKHAKGRTPKEKESRRINDFIKNTLPKLDKGEKIHFARKFKAKGYTLRKKYMGGFGGKDNSK